MGSMEYFKDRSHAGKLLAKKLATRKFNAPVVYAMPRGGVILGVEVAKFLGCPLDIVITRKIGHPQNPEYAIGAISEGGMFVGDESRTQGFDLRWLEEQKKKASSEARRRRMAYMGKKSISAKGKTAIIVDDGIATGYSIMAAAKELQSQHPARLVIAAAVCPADTTLKLKPFADEIVLLISDEAFLGAVGAYYDDFGEVTDEEVKSALRSS